MGVWTGKDSRGASTKTRIETAELGFAFFVSGFIQEAHPLKQGLKLQPGLVSKGVIEHSRGASTKTRIETARNAVTGSSG